MGNASNDLEHIRNHCRFWLSTVFRVAMDAIGIVTITFIIASLTAWIDTVDLPHYYKAVIHWVVYGFDLVLLLWLIRFIAAEIIHIFTKNH